MAFIYTRAQFKSRINAGIQGKIGMLVDANETMNETIREVLATCDLVSTRRQVDLAPNLFGIDVDTVYGAPSDLSGYNIIDVPQQAKRSDGEFFLVPSREFLIRKELGSIAIDDQNGIKTLYIASKIDSVSTTWAEMDSLSSGGGTWVAFGDGTNLVSDTDDFINGAGSISWDISAAGGTTAGIVNNGLNSLDVTPYTGGNGAVFVYFKINSVTGLTNLKLRIGSTSANYYTLTATTRHDGTAFVTGWNLIRFDLINLTSVQTGTPVITAFRYSALYITKTAGKISETQYKFDWLTFAKGQKAQVSYYSKYGWQSSAGAYKENSTDDSDFLVADFDEYNLLIKFGRLLAAEEVDSTAPGRNPLIKIQDMRKSYDAAKKDYMMRNPSEAKIMTNIYYDYGNNPASTTDGIKLINN